MSLEEIDSAVAEYFLFVARRDLWTRYVMKTLNGSIRPATRAVLEMWRNPIVLFGRVTTVQEGHFLVEEVLGHETYYVELEPEMDVEKGLLVFGVVLVDNRLQENGIHLLGGLTFIHDHNRAFTQQIEAMAEASGLSNSFEFFKAHMVDIHKAIVEREINDVEDLVERELTPLQQEVITVLVNQLDELDAPPEIIEIYQMFAVSYLLAEKPKFRKTEVIAAAVFKAAYDYGLLGPYQLSQADRVHSLSHPKTPALLMSPNPSDSFCNTFPS